jgi:hypothetical protein
MPARLSFAAVDGLVMILPASPPWAKWSGGTMGRAGSAAYSRQLARCPSAGRSASPGQPASVHPVTGRLDETDFEDVDHRPLVFRRTRLGRDRPAAQDFDVVREPCRSECGGLDAIAIITDARQAQW